MATTSFLYHAQALRGYKHLRTEYRNGCEYHYIEQSQHKRRCANEDCCARWWKLTLAGTFERTFLGLPVGRRKQFIVLLGHRQDCAECGCKLQEAISFTEGKARHSKSFARYVLDLCAVMTIKQVALLLGVGWDLVKDLHKRYLKKRLKKRKLSRIRYIAVDEFAVQKGHRYMTVVIDLETGEILHAHEGKDAAALLPFLERLKRSKNRLKAVAIDMSPAYLLAVRQVFGDTVDVVHDPYHVVALASRAIDETRRDLVRQLEGEQKQVVKGTRFLLLKGMENLSDNGLERLMELMEANEPLYQAYLLKEDLRMFWNFPNAKLGEEFLDTWIGQAQELGNAHFTKLAKTIDEHRTGLLSYFKHRISTGPLEGLNNKIKVLKRQAYGFRDMEYFRLRLYFLHEATLAMTAG